MEFLHLIQLNEKNFYNTLKQIHEIKKDEDKHIFYICNYKRMTAAFTKFREFNDFLYVDENASNFSKAFNLLKLMIKADHIIINSLIFNSNKYLYFLYVFKFLLKKATWIEWGADLYVWKLEGITLKNRIFNYINFSIRKSVKYIGVTFEGDIATVHKTIRKDVKCFFTPLVFGKNRLELIEKTKTEKDDNTINIQIAHNSYPFNKHIECLDKIKKFNNEDIRIFLPFSYGNYNLFGVAGENSYKEKVNDYLIRHFDKDKINFLSKFMDLPDYLKYLWNIDIAIFASERPIGLANIIYLLYMNKKVFLPQNSPQYIFFRNKNLNVYPIEKIPELSFDEFIFCDKKRDNKYAIDRLKTGADIQYWEYLFNYLKEVNKK